MTIEKEKCEERRKKGEMGLAVVNSHPVVHTNMACGGNKRHLRSKKLKLAAKFSLQSLSSYLHV